MAKRIGATSRQLADEFMEAVLSLPDGEKVKQCIQCGTCSGACPTSHAMDYTPREIIAALRAGMLDRVLNSNTMWMCSSCYGCTVRCPSGIKLTDVMYELKSLATKHGVRPKGVSTPALQAAFVAEVEAHGRNAEVGLMRRFFLGTNPFDGLRNLGLALAMKQRGRLSLGSSSVSPEGQRQLKAIAEKARGG
ncbi:MAG: 4Fe-4S dicluster domain-containing protein [Armatimonadetes bacterium]|nr:4Fe-4S dicluster domain-containing protein [Armatimonadota bacterium]